VPKNTNPLAKRPTPPTRSNMKIDRQFIYWQLCQDALLLLGVALVATLLISPSLGLDLLWNGLIPLAPILLVVFPGVWRNVCPMASFSLLPQRLGLGLHRPLPRHQAALFTLLGFIALILIVPLRHISLDTNANASALMLLFAATVAILAGLFYESRSAWCNSLCPIHPAEKLYGQIPAWTAINARCEHCCKCSRPCPDSARLINPTITGSTGVEQIVGHVMLGGFSGFIWGWHQVGDINGPLTSGDIFIAYAWPIGAGAISLSSYTLAYRIYGKSPDTRRQLSIFYSWAAVTVYYWFRIPALMGFSDHPGTGILFDWTGQGEWPAWISRLLSTTFLTWFMLLRNKTGSSWLTRPPEK